MTYNKQLKDSVLNSLNEYENMNEFLQCENMDKMEFEEMIGDGWYFDITCGTYNGATDTFTAWKLTNDNIIDTLYQLMPDFDFYNFVDEITENESINNNWDKLQYINELVNFYDIIIIKDINKIYIDMN